MLPPTVFLIVAILFASASADSQKTSLKAELTVQATNNTLVPSVTYIVDAVECLKEAYTVFADDESRAMGYEALFNEKHNGTWNVVIGYTAVSIKSDLYIEAKVSEGGQQFQNKNWSPDKLVLIFSS